MLESFQLALAQGSGFAYLLSFGAGVLASLTPCVYPMIPITVSLITKRATSHAHAVELSLVYVLGMAVMYACLGILAALTGKIFGYMTVSTPVYLFVGIVILFFGCVEMGWLQLKLPSWFTSNRLTQGRGGAFVMGLTSGIVAAPCTVPILGVILTYIATQQSLFYGASLMFTFALGLGLLLFAIGVSSGVLKHLPKSGVWMHTLEKLAAFIFFAIGFYFIYQAFHI